MDLIKLMLSLGNAVQKNDVAKGCLLGSATAIGTGGAVYIVKKLLEKKKEEGLNINIDKT